MANWQDGYAHANGIDIHYHRTGGAGKPPIILLHGIADNGLCWTRVARDLQDSYDMIMPDARGHSRTGGPVDGISVSMLADDVAALISALELEQPYLFGHSMGAITAMFVAANYPELVRALVLEDPPLFDVERTEQEAEARLQGARAIREMPREQLIAHARRDNPHWAEDEVGPWADSKAEFDPGVMLLKFEVPWREILARITCPLLLITGETGLGALVTAAQAKESTRLAQSGEVAYLSGAGHCIHRDRYDESMELVRDFLRRTQ